MNPETERKKEILVKAAYLALILGIYYAICKYVIYALMPFVVAAVVTFVLKRPVDKVSEKLKIPRKGVAGFFMFLFYAVIAFAIVLAVIRLVWAATAWAANLPYLYYSKVEPYVRAALEWYEDMASMLSPEKTGYVEKFANDFLGKAAELITYISGKLISFLQSFVVSVPGAAISVVFCVIASFFISMDFPRIEHFVLAQFSENGKNIVTNAFTYIRDGIGKMLRSYLLIMFITFVELNIGLRILHIGNPTLVAFLIAIFDILPALGTGGVVIPWAIITALIGNYKLAIELFIMYLIITVIRNIIEPKIVGESIGVHPLLMLMSIFIGAKLFGVLGIIILPFTMIVLRNLNDQGYIHLFNSEYMPKRKNKKNKKSQQEQKENTEA